MNPGNIVQLGFPAATGAAAGNTLDQAYDQGGAGAGRAITASDGAVAITVPDASNNAVLVLTQNDTTNDPDALQIVNLANSESLDIDARHTGGGAIAHIRYGAATTWDTPGLVGLRIDLETNVTPGATNINGIELNIPGTSGTTVRGFLMDYNATRGTMFEGNYSNATTLTGALTGLFLEMNGEVTAGTNAITGALIRVATTTGAHFALDVEDFNAGAEGARVRFYHVSPSPLAGDDAFKLQVDGESSTGLQRELGSMRLSYDTVTNASEDSGWDWYTINGGASNLAMTLGSDGDLRVDVDSGAAMAAVVGLFDDWNDVAVIDDVLHAPAKGVEQLEDMGIVTRGKAGNRMFSMRKGLGLAYGGMVQMRDRILELEARLVALEGRN